MSEIWKGILIPFLGTSLGAACVFPMKSELNLTVQRILNHMIIVPEVNLS